ncbi:hypothetical protein NSQ62_10475 [Solibacillus sp. FSL H8-0523]|uniref:hypothetical protein n=1 Tax=Solibacillus sp. FSL H8-0523 TaxID=2954511 RepID=UPI003101206D
MKKKVGVGIRITQTPFDRNLIITIIAFLFILLSVALLSGCEEKQSEVAQEEEATSSLTHPIDERYINIAQYELFYLNERMESKENVTFQALRKAIEVHALFEYLEAQDIRIEPEKLELQRKLMSEQLAYDLQNSDFQHYFDQLKKALQIDEQDYIEQYLLVNKNYESLKSEMTSTKVGLQVDADGQASYPTSESEQDYRDKMGLSFDYLEYIAESMPYYLPEPINAPNVLFDKDYQRLTTNREGEVIFRGKQFSTSDLTMDQLTFMHHLDLDYQLPGLARYNFSTYQELLQKVAHEDVNKRDMAEQILAVLTVVETTLDWEFGELFVYDGVMPTFDTENLRKHKDITFQLIEHEFYYRSEQMPGKLYAYRVATEKIVEMYGLFNYLQKDFDVAFDAQTLASIRAEQEQSLQQQLEDPYFKHYLDNVLETYQITLETYLDDYLMVLAEYEALVKRMEKEPIGLDGDGRYNKGDVHARYRNATQLSWTQQFEKMDQLKYVTKVQALDPQPELAFEIPEGLEIGLTDEGHYVFTEVIGFFPMWLNEEQQTFLAQLKRDHALPEFSRSFIPHYVARLEKTENSAIQQQLIELIKIYRETLAL